MASPAHIALRRGLWLLALAAWVTAFAPQPAAARAGSGDACLRWTQRYLVIGNDLQARRFLVEPTECCMTPMPAFKVAGDRSVLHKPYKLLLDVNDRVAIFQSNAAKVCVLSRDRFSTVMEIPVFFVGRPGQSRDELRKDAENLVFDPSAPVSAGSDFSDVSFHLRRGGSRFNEIRPFFLCGLAGLLVCQESCPGDTITLAASLVNDIVRGDVVSAPGREETNPPASSFRRSQPPSPQISQAPSTAPEVLEPAPMPPPRSRSAETCPPGPERTETAPPPRKSEAPSAYPPEAQPVSPPPPAKEPARRTQRAETETPAPKVEAAPPPPPAPALPPKTEVAPPPAPQPQAPETAAPPVKTPPPAVTPVPVLPPKTEVTPPPAPRPQAPETAAPPAKAPPPATAPAPVPALPPKTEVAPAPAPRPQAPETAAPPAKAPPSAPPPAAPEPLPPAAPPPPQRVVLAFEHNGKPLPPAEVLEAEGSLSIDGTPLQATSDGLTADLPPEAAKHAGDPAYLKKLLRKNQLLAVKKDGDRTVLVVDPLYVRADDLKIDIQNAAGEPVHDCDVRLDVSADRRLGPGWAKLADKERTTGLEFTETDNRYALNLPVEVEPNELLISTAEPGNVALLTKPACQLENRPWVTASELKSEKIVRSLLRIGPPLIAVFSTDSGFAGAVGGPAAAEGFWSDALRLVNVVSTAAWEKKVLARAQAPGGSPETGKLQVEGQGGALAGDGNRGGFLRMLGRGSQGTPGAASIFQIQPVDRNSLDLALQLIRQDAGIAAQYSVRQESLVFITGSVEETSSDLCEFAGRRDKSPLSLPQWWKQSRKVFALEVWSARAIDDMQKSARIKPPQNAPDGIYICNAAGPDADKIALYGIATKAVSDPTARAKAFAYLTGQANSFLKP